MLFRSSLKFKIAKKIEDSGYYANPTTNALGGVLFPFGPVFHNEVVDSRTPDNIPSRLARISLPTILGGVGGGLIGYAADNDFMHALIGNRLGSGLGAYLGANDYNHALARALKEKKR